MNWNDIERAGKALASEQRRIEHERSRIDAEAIWFLAVVGPILILLCVVAVLL